MASVVSRQIVRIVSLALVAALANGGEALGIIRIRIPGSDAQRWAMIEHKEAEDQARAAIGTIAVLA